jgi:hypothetical protein
MSARLLPYILIGILALSVISLWAAVSFQSTVFVQIFYPTIILVSGGVIVACLWSTVAYALNRFSKYWITGYPVLLVAAFCAYATLKLPIQPIILPVVLGVLVVSYFIGTRLAGPAFRFMPVATTVVFLVVGELSIPRESKMLFFGACIGLLAGSIIKTHLNQSPSESPPSLTSPRYKQG